MPGRDQKPVVETRWRWPLGIALLCLVASGAQCPQIVQQYTQPIPRALPAAPSLGQILDIVNANSARVQSLSAMRSKIVTPGMPAVNADIAFQRPRFFRLQAEAPLIKTTEVDMGSNQDLFWFYLRRAEPPAVLVCRHDQFAASQARELLPVEPDWLIEALGIVTLDASMNVEGPFPVSAGRVELKIKAPTADGVARIIIVDDSRGIILEEHVYNSRGQRLASAIMSRHVRDPASGATLPRHVDIDWPHANLNLSIEMPDLRVNQLVGNPQTLFVKPVYAGVGERDLAQPGALGPPAGSAGPVRLPSNVRY